jgi:hypothetical protein
MDMVLTEKQRACIPDVTFELIPINQLVSDQEYQRNLSESHILKAIQDFDVNQINTVKVSRRDGINYVVDGQHTIEIVAAKSESRTTPVWCMIHTDLGYKEEAHLFAEQQTHVKPLTPYEKFKGHIEAHDEDQIMIATIVKSYGLELSGYKIPRSVRAITTMERIYRKYGYHVLDGALRLIVGTWEGEVNSLSGSMIAGAARLIVVFGDSLREDVFKEHVGRVSVRQLSRMAKERRPGALGYAEAMILAYNTKNKFHLSMRKLYGGKGDDTDEEVSEQDTN